MSETKPDGKYTQLELIHQEEQAFQKFAALKLANDDSVNIPKIYFDITGDFAAAAVLDEILFWTLPNKKRNKTALRVRKDGVLWLAVSRPEWWERKRITERQADRAIDLLIEKGMIEKSVHRFSGHAQMHLRVKGKEFFLAYGKALQELYLDGAESDDEPLRELNDLYALMGIETAPKSESPNRESPNRESRNGDTDSPNGDTESPNRNTLNSLQQASNKPPKSTTGASREISAKIFKAYEAEIGLLTPTISEAIGDYLDDLKIPPEWILEAISEAARQNKRNWAYIAAILKRWAVEGKTSLPPKITPRGPRYPQPAQSDRLTNEKLDAWVASKEAANVQPG